LFGAGNIAAKTARRLQNKFDYILDNNPAMWGLEELNVKILNPDEILKTNTKKPFIIICTTSFNEISIQLQGYGYVAKKDFIVSPILNDLRIIDKLESSKGKILFTSGSPPQDKETTYGGGIYELEYADGNHSYKKVFSGNTHGIIRFNENFVAVDDHLGIIEFDKNYKILRKKDLPLGSRGHGISYSENTKSFYVAASHSDCIIILNNDLKIINEIYLSEKFKRNKSPAHHCNDLIVSGDSLYVSMFSHTGNWKNDIFDGVVLEIDLVTGNKIGPVISNLWMPHNVDIINGRLVVLDSLRGNFLMNNAEIAGTFPGFTRGLGYDGEFFYIGQSRNRNYSKNIGLSNNISLDTSIIVFDSETKVSRSLSLPSKLSEIHGLIII